MKSSSILIVVFSLACVAVSFVSMAPTESPNDFKNEFDRLLVATALENFRVFEHRLAELQTQIDRLQVTKSKSEQDKIVRELEVGINFFAGAQATFERELTRTDLDLLERFNYESALAMGKVILADLKVAEAKVKAIATN